MYEGAIQDLIDALGRLPGIGPKSAQRIAFHILQTEPEVAANLVESIRTVRERVVVLARFHRLARSHRQAHGTSHEIREFFQLHSHLSILQRRKCVNYRDVDPCRSCI